VVVASGSSPAPAGARSPVVADDTSVTGVSDRWRNRRRRRRRGLDVTITSDVMVEGEVSAKGLADDKVVCRKYADRRADHRRGMSDSALPKAKVVRPKVDRKGKGNAIDAYEQGGPSRVTEWLNRPPPAELTRPPGPLVRLARQPTPPPITTIDNDESMGFTLGLFAPPKSIIKRRASDSDITSSAIQA